MRYPIPLTLAELVSRKDCPVKGRVVLAWRKAMPSGTTLRMFRNLDGVTAVRSYSFTVASACPCDPGDTVILCDGLEEPAPWGVHKRVLAQAWQLMKADAVMYIILRTGSGVSSGDVKRMLSGYYRTIRVMSTENKKHKIVRCQ